jgi:hypothetical protein
MRSALTEGVCGFRPGRSLESTHLLLANLLAEAKAANAPMTLLSFDLSKRFDRLPWQPVCDTLRHINVPPQLVSALERLNCDLKRIWT